MYVLLAYRKLTSYHIIDECVGPFGTHDGAIRWAEEKWELDGVDENNERTVGKYDVVVKFMECPL